MNDIVKPVGEITEESVATFLKAHPHFFEQHKDLLSDLHIPHQNGQTVSLVERQVAVLRDRNVEMRQRLTSLLDNARDNDRLFDKTKRLVLALVESPNLSTCVNALMHSFEHDFNIHQTQVILFHPNTLAAGNARVEDIFCARATLGQRIQSRKTVMGGLDVKEIEYIFGHDHQVGSAALTVLNHGQLLGVLAIGNQDPMFYNNSMGTLFLGYISDVFSRVLPRHIEAAVSHG